MIGVPFIFPLFKDRDKRCSSSFLCVAVPAVAYGMCSAHGPRQKGTEGTAACRWMPKGGEGLGRRRSRGASASSSQKAHKGALSRCQRSSASPPLLKREAEGGEDESVGVYQTARAEKGSQKWTPCFCPDPGTGSPRQRNLKSLHISQSISQSIMPGPLKSCRHSHSALKGPQLLVTSSCIAWGPIKFQLGPWLIFF